MRKIEILKWLLIIAILLLADILNAQSPQLWVEGNVSTVTIESQSFESGLSPYTNSGLLNFTINPTQSTDGANSAYSGYLSNGNYSVLSRTITVPANITAKLTFDHKANFIGTWTGQVGLIFSTNAAILSQLFSTTDWTEVELYLPAGSHTLVWECYSYGNFHALEYYLDNVQISYVESTAIKLQDGNEGEGKVLSSDYQGNATWKSISELKNGLTDVDYLVPLIIDGDNNNEHENLVEIKNNTGENGLSISNTFIGAELFDNSFGINAYDNSTAFRAENNSIGFNSNFNNTGFSSNTDNYGLEVSFATSSGVDVYNSDVDGIVTNWNDQDGISTEWNTRYGIYSALNFTAAGYFSGSVEVTGNLTKGGGSFKIDHPLDPENKYLYHSFVESPDMMNIYNGNITLDENGEAVVKLEDWFEPLNRDFRYQLTPIGAPGPNLYIAEQVNAQQFKIAGGEPGSMVSWQLTGIRQDKYAEAHRIEVEVEKEEEFKGYYLHPEVYGFGFERGFDFVLNGYRSMEEIKKERAERAENPLGLQMQNSSPTNTVIGF